ncbi:MAG: DUF4328 domain-containing protein, partial [Flavobacteriales bacterium]
MATMMVALVAVAYQLYGVFLRQNLINEAMAGSVTAAEAYQDLDKFNPLAMIIGLAGILNVIAVCMFIYAAAKNVFEYYSGAIQYSPGLIVGWFFIPVAHIFMAYKGVREVSKASNAMIESKESKDIADTKPHQTAVIWGILWSIQAALIYVSMVVGFSSFGELSEVDLEERAIIIFQKTFYIQIVMNVLSFINGIALIMFAAKITKEQNAYRTS